jgi:hypothetical protein
VGYLLKGDDDCRSLLFPRGGAYARGPFSALCTASSTEQILELINRTAHAAALSRREATRIGQLKSGRQSNH